ncbi:unnamed protein product [Fraxinus pennsylvanica]|uniref:Glycosyltransferase n=1 Tax=Fraxinus pennsylvanica TaxID=56036 RepID=A0AAD1ZSJ3_9LAMI|nr:unnamed protein product [Fraxinus pennsylvanica]
MQSSPLRSLFVGETSEIGVGASVAMLSSKEGPEAGVGVSERCVGTGAGVGRRLFHSSRRCCGLAHLCEVVVVLTVVTGGDDGMQWWWMKYVAGIQLACMMGFGSEPALVFSIAYHLDLLRENGHFPCKDNVEENINYIPGVSSMNTRDLMSFLKESEIKRIIQKIVIKTFDDEVQKAYFILLSTIQELEFEAISALHQKQPTGPINFSTDSTKPVISQNLWPQTDTKAWLDSKPPSSVLYLLFGSFVQTNTDVLPVEFTDKIRDQGLVVQWCNQNMVLSHLSIRGFLTHCGWNSVLESIWCGVPMICYPLRNDQPTNRKLVVDDWKIGINLCDRESVTKEEVAEKIDNLMNDTVLDGLKMEITFN